MGSLQAWGKVTDSTATRERRYAEREVPIGFGFFALALALDHPTRMGSDGAKPNSYQVRMSEVPARPAWTAVSRLKNGRHAIC
jgi:hypothetical protein